MQKNHVYFRSELRVLLLGLLSLFLSTSCTNQLYIKVLQHAPVHVGEHIKTIALVNRTKPQDAKANKVESVLTGEGLYQDKSGVDNAFGGLNDFLNNSPRFQVKQTNLYLAGSGIGNVFPAPLSWDAVNKICNEYQADAVCVIETYDTDTQIMPGTRLVENKGQNGIGLPKMEFYANLRAQVQIGFRLYDPARKTIRDECNFKEVLTWTGSGMSPAQALTVLLDKTAATNRVSYVIGEKYAARITPAWIRVERTYYRKGGRHEMKQAFRMAYVNDWEGAAALWSSIIPSSKRVTAGKAAYNLAIANEVLGNLDEAKAWAAKAYAQYGNKMARDYSYVLDRRIRENQRLNTQMKSVANNN